MVTYSDALCIPRPKPGDQLPSDGGSSGGDSGEGNGTGGGNGAEVPTYDQFKEAVNSYPGGARALPSEEVYNMYVKHVTPTIKTLKEQAQLLANLVWESDSLTATEEYACKDTPCSYSPYHGRGYIQLTHDYNYKAAGEAIYGRNYYQEGENYKKVAEPEDAWKTAVWFWNTQVKADPAAFETALNNGDLGYSVRKINGGIECAPTGSPEGREKPPKRLHIYKGIIKAWNLDVPNPNLQSCDQQI